jgi:hypothetical protein
MVSSRCRLDHELDGRVGGRRSRRARYSARLTRSTRSTPASSNGVLRSSGSVTRSTRRHVEFSNLGAELTDRRAAFTDFVDGFAGFVFS